jgi:hypothetical protein
VLVHSNCKSTQVQKTRTESASVVSQYGMFVHSTIISDKLEKKRFLTTILECSSSSNRSLDSIIKIIITSSAINGTVMKWCKNGAVSRVMRTPSEQSRIA